MSLEIGCNAGFWSIQARRAGARSVLGVDLGPKNIEQADFIRDLIGLDGLEYRVMNAYEVSKEALGDFDVTFSSGSSITWTSPSRPSSGSTR